MNPNDDLPVAIVGAGFSGTLLAINLIRQGVKVVLVERDGTQLAKGLAFGTRRPEHLLNVRAANMSAFPDDPDHFLRWLGVPRGEAGNRFVPRLAYGSYLRELLVGALPAVPGRAEVREGDVVAARFDADMVTLALRSGTPIRCRALVLALGNLPPSPQPLLAGLPDGRYFADAWQPGATADLAGLDHVLLLGSGLTAADVVLSLEAGGYRGRITALSRRGLKPHSHAESGPVVEPRSEPNARGAGLVRAVRERARVVDWRAAVDELRPHMQQLWRRHDTAAQGRFLRHLRPYWDIHRHRLAPAVASRIAALEDSGRLAFRAGRLTGVTPTATGLDVRWRPRGSGTEQVMRADRIIGCIGPEGDIARAGHPLLRDLVAQERVRPDVHRLGLDVDRSGHVRDAGGVPQQRLFAVGPITKGEAWEIVAVPDIRRQVWDLARLLANTHWIDGEGL